MRAKDAVRLSTLRLMAAALKDQDIAKRSESGPGELDEAEILACIRCGACLNACPVYKQIGGHAFGDTYPGPMGSILTPSLRGIGAWKDLPQASSLCGACRDVCPLRIDIPRMLLSLRRRSQVEEGAPWSLRVAMKLFAFMAIRPRLYRWSRRLAGTWLRRRARD